MTKDLRGQASWATDPGPSLHASTVYSLGFIQMISKKRRELKPYLSLSIVFVLSLDTVRPLSLDRGSLHTCARPPQRAGAARAPRSAAEVRRCGWFKTFILEIPVSHFFAQKMRIENGIFSRE